MLNLTLLVIDYHFYIYNDFISPPILIYKNYPLI